MTKKIKPDPIPATVYSPSIGLRSYFSRSYLMAARYCAAEASRIETGAELGQEILDTHRTYVTAAVIQSVAFLEATINEVFIDAVEDHKRLASVSVDVRAAWSACWSDLDMLKMFLKYKMALRLAGADLFNPGQAPHQDASLVNDLRNMIVHYKTETQWTDTVSTLEQTYGNKFEENRLVSKGNPYAFSRMLGAGCAELPSDNYTWARRQLHLCKT